MKLGGRARVPDQAPSSEHVQVPVIEPMRPSDLNLVNGGRRLGELLVTANLISPASVVAALAEAQRGPLKLLGRRLVDGGFLGDRDLARVVAWQQSLDVVDLRATTPEPAATRLLDEATARRVVAIPLSVSRDTLVVAAAFPTAIAKEEIHAATGLTVVMKVAAESDIYLAIGGSYRALTGITSQVRAFEQQHSTHSEPTQLEVSASDEAPVVQVVQMIITQALRDRASDVHIEPHEDKVRVRYRIDGALHDVLDLPASMGPAVVSRVKILASMNIVERRRPQDGQISMEIEGRGVDIRVSTTAVIEGEKVVLRLLDKSRTLYRLGQLGMPEDMVARYTQAFPEAGLWPERRTVCCSVTRGSG